MSLLGGSSGGGDSASSSASASNVFGASKGFDPNIIALIALALLVVVVFALSSRK